MKVPGMKNGGWRNPVALFNWLIFRQLWCGHFLRFVCLTQFFPFFGDEADDVADVPGGNEIGEVGEEDDVKPSPPP